MAITIAGKSDFPYDKQIGSLFCGPACAHMMLKYFQVLVTPTDGKSEQEMLNDYKVFAPPNAIAIQNPPTAWTVGGWITSPNELVNMLHKADADSVHWINYFDKAKHGNNPTLTKGELLWP